MVTQPSIRVWAGGGRPVTLEGGPLPLHGLLFEPSGERDPRVAVLHIHGRGANMATPPGSSLAERVAIPAVAHLTMNLRAHDLGYTAVPERGGDPPTPSDYEVAGGMWEQVHESVADIDVAVRALRSRGYTRIVGAAHSAGGLSLATYAGEHPGLAGRIMLSPLTGSTQSLTRLFGDEAGVTEAVERARELKASGQGHILLPARQWYFAISATSLLDRLSQPVNAWARAMDRDSSPCLIVWGGAETRAGLWRDSFDALRSPIKRAVEIPNAGHYYVGQHAAVGTAVTDFVNEVILGSAR